MNFDSLPDIPPHPSKTSRILTGEKAVERFQQYKHTPPKGVNRHLTILSKQMGSRYFNALFAFEEDYPEGAWIIEFEYKNKTDLEKGLPHVQLLGEITLATLNMAIGPQTSNPFAN